MVVMLLSVAEGCVAWHTRIPPAPTAEVKREARARVWLWDDSYVELSRVEIRADSVVGVDARSERRAIAVAAVKRLEAGRVSTLLTGALSLVLLAGAFLWVAYNVQGGPGS